MKDDHTNNKYIVFSLSSFFLVSWFLSDSFVFDYYQPVQIKRVVFRGRISVTLYFDRSFSF